MNISFERDQSMDKKPIWESKTTWTGLAMIAAAVVPEPYKQMATTVLLGLAVIFLRMGVEDLKDPKK
jgi:hypothetical protein